MNKSNVLHLADLIESLPESSFHMDDLTRCGTPACIAGWAAYEGLGRPKHLPKEGLDFSSCPIIEAALSYLGIEDKLEQSLVCDELFRGIYTRGDSRDITQAEAAKVLRHYAETGEIKWQF